MKIKKFTSLIVAITCTIMFIVPVLSADTRASAQIAAYNMEVIPLTDELAIYITITGNGPVNKIGCESIYIYELVQSRWVLRETMLEDDPGMSSDDTYAHKNVICWDSSRGTHYKVEVTVFGENDAGRDTRSETFFVTGQ